MRHEKTIEIDNDNNLISVLNRNRNKIKKNIVTLTAKDSDIQQDKDTDKEIQYLNKIHDAFEDITEAEKVQKCIKVIKSIKCI